ncbi:unnamed protein product, partial [Brassica rapa]
MCVRQHTHDVRGCPSVHISARWSLDSARWPFPWTGRYRQDVRGCSSAHTGRPCLSVSTHRTSVVFRVCPCVSVSTHRTTHRTALCVRQHKQDVRGCPCVSVCVRQHTQNVCGCPCVSVCVRQHTQNVCGCPCVSVCVRQHTQNDVRGTLALPVDCSGDFGPRGLSIQYTQDVCGCPLAHTGRPWVTSVAVRVCPCVSVSTHMTSVAVHQYTYQHAGPWTQHAGPSVHCLGDFDPRGLTHSTSVGVRQHTQDVRGCLRSWLSVSTDRTSVAVRVCQCLSVCVRKHTQDVRGWPSVHISARWSLDLARWPFPWTGRVILSHVGCLFSTHRTTSVCVRQHTQDVRGCPCVSMCVRQHTENICGCPSVHISARWSLDSARWPFRALPRGLSVQYTQDVRGCPPAYTGHPWLSVSTDRTSVAVRVCQCVS